MPLTRSYSEYLAVASTHGFTAISPDQWAARQAVLPDPKQVEMPLSLNHAIGLTIEAGDPEGAKLLIQTCSDEHQECWLMYTTVGDSFPAGGLWMNQFEWLEKSRLDATPLTVAHMLDFNGELPDDITKFEIEGKRYYFDEDHVVVFDGDEGWDYLPDHKLETPTIEAVSALVKMGMTGNEWNTIPSE